jgi:hypothetical protein
MLVCDQYASLISGLIAGHGVALLPHYVASHYLDSGHLVRVLPGWQGGSWPVYLVFPYRQPLPKNTKPSSSMSPRACAPCWKNARCIPAKSQHLPRQLDPDQSSQCRLLPQSRVRKQSRIRRIAPQEGSNGTSGYFDRRRGHGGQRPGLHSVARA